MHTSKSLAAEITSECIYNYCSNFELWDDRDSQIDASGKWYDQGRPFAVFEDVKIFELQRKHVRSDDQSKSTSTLLFVAWKSEGYNDLRVLVQLLECDKTFDWRQVGRKEYCQLYASQFRTYTDPIKDTWLTCDGKVLMTELGVGPAQKDWRDGALNVTISETVRGDHTKRPKWIGPEV
jgi:hypothetical protein